MKEKAEIYRRAVEDLMSEFLPVLDHVELALKAVGASTSNDPVTEGFRIVAGQFDAALKRVGLEPVETKGKQFDHNLHEAISHIIDETVPENMVISQVRKGYTLGGKLVRAAQVVVAGRKQPVPAVEPEKKAEPGKTEAVKPVAPEHEKNPV